MAGWNQGGVQEDFSQSGLGIAKTKAGPTWSELLRQTYALYWVQFKTFFLIALPPAACAYFCFFLQRIIVRSLRAQGWMPSSSLQASIVFTLVALFEGAIYWLISGFFFAAIASNVLGTDEDDRPVIADAFRCARKHFGAVAGVSLLIWSAFNLGRMILGFAVFSVLDRLNLIRNVVLGTITFGIILFLLAGLISRAGLAIPVLIDRPEVSIRQSLRLSIANTESWELFFMVFLAKTAILGYAIFWALKWALPWAYRPAFPLQDSRFWFESIIYICMAAALESPLFIAFSLLYQHSKQSLETTQEETRPAVAIH